MDSIRENADREYTEQLKSLFLVCFTFSDFAVAFLSKTYTVKNENNGWMKHRFLSVLCYQILKK